MYSGVVINGPEQWVNGGRRVDDCT